MGALLHALGDSHEAVCAACGGVFLGSFVWVFMTACLACHVGLVVGIAIMVARAISGL